MVGSQSSDSDFDYMDSNLHNFDRLPDVKIDRHNLKYHEIARVKYNLGRKTSENKERVLFVQGKEMSRASPDRKLVAYTHLSSKDILFGLFGRGLKKHTKNIPLGLILEYEPLQPRVESDPSEPTVRVVSRTDH